MYLKDCFLLCSIGNQISYEDFARGYAIFGFTLSPDLGCDTDHFQLIKSGNLRLELKFKEPIAQPLIVVCYGETDNLVEVDRSRQVLVDFTV